MLLSKDTPAGKRRAGTTQPGLWSRVPVVSRCAWLIQAHRRLPGRDGHAGAEADPSAGQCVGPDLSPAHTPGPG